MWRFKPHKLINCIHERSVYVLTVTGGAAGHEPAVPDVPRGLRVVHGLLSSRSVTAGSHRIRHWTSFNNTNGRRILSLENR